MLPDRSGVDGVLGLEAMLPLEIDVDLPARQLTLFAAGSCPDAASRLPGRSMTFRSPANPHLQFAIQAKADGHDVSLIVDTGVDVTIFSAAALGLRAADLTNDRSIDTNTAGADRGKATLHRIGRVEIGEFVYQNTQFPVVPSIPFRFGGALGNDFWGDHRFWLSQATGTVTVALPQRSPSTP